MTLHNQHTSDQRKIEISIHGAILYFKNKEDMLEEIGELVYRDSPLPPPNIEIVPPPHRMHNEKIIIIKSSKEGKTDPSTINALRDNARNSITWLKSPNEFGYIYVTKKIQGYEKKNSTLVAIEVDPTELATLLSSYGATCYKLKSSDKSTILSSNSINIRSNRDWQNIPSPVRGIKSIKINASDWILSYQTSIDCNDN
ncbi:TPA: hypothetical protein ACXJQH_005115 [Pseudomonas aeruginosa]